MESICICRCSPDGTLPPPAKDHAGIFRTTGRRGVVVFAIQGFAAMRHSNSVSGYAKGPGHGFRLPSSLARRAERTSRRQTHSPGRSSLDDAGNSGGRTAIRSMRRHLLPGGLAAAAHTRRGSGGRTWPTKSRNMAGQNRKSCGIARFFNQRTGLGQEAQPLS